MSKNISIIGCGWLGLPLAKHLISKGHQLKGSTTSKDKLENLKELGIEAFYVEIGQDHIKGSIEGVLAESDILILNVPPGLRKHPDLNFVQQMALIIPYIETSSVSKVIFISSTSVYAEDETLPTITEETVAMPISESGRQLLEVESLLQHNSNFQTTILRLSGLFGAERHPATYLSGKTEVKNPHAPVDLIHLDDCISIIGALIENEVWDQTFNVATTGHPSRKEFYTTTCHALDLPVPEFSEKTTSRGKLIDSKKLVRYLGYEFQHTLNN